MLVYARVICIYENNKGGPLTRVSESQNGHARVLCTHNKHNSNNNTNNNINNNKHTTNNHYINNNKNNNNK